MGRMWRTGGLCLVVACLGLAQAQSSCNCANGGLCTTVSGVVQCNCAGTGYTGSLCDVPLGSSSNSSAPASSSSSCPVACFNGDCTQQYNSELYYCKCKSGFMGENCNMTAASPSTAPSSNPTCPVPCFNGLCTQVYNSDTYYCKCNNGYNGTACNSTSTSTSATAVPPTSTTKNCPVTCLNGRCTQEYNSESYYCLCNTGWTGNTCGSAAAPAISPAVIATNQSCPVACVNGKCTQQYNSDSYYCKCNSGYAGNSCNSLATPAAGPAVPANNQNCPVTCVNGDCTHDYDSDLYYCKCKSGYSGQTCNAVSASHASAAGPTLGTTQAINVCGNGAACYYGSCLQQSNGTSYCRCSSGYQGSSCNQIVSTATSSGKQTGGGHHLGGAAIFGIVVAVMVGLLIIGAAGFALWQRSRRQTFVKFHGSASYLEEVEISKQNKTGII